MWGYRWDTVIHITDANVGTTVAYSDNQIPSRDDALNRLASISYPTATLDVHYCYDQAIGRTGCASSNPIGRLTEMVDATGTTTYCYDTRGNVILKRQIGGGDIYATGCNWNTADRLMGMTYPDGATVTYTRDAGGRIASVSASGFSSSKMLKASETLAAGPSTLHPCSTSAIAT